MVNLDFFVMNERTAQMAIKISYLWLDVNLNHLLTVTMTAKISEIQH